MFKYGKIIVFREFGFIWLILFIGIYYVIMLKGRKFWRRKFFSYFMVKFLEENRKVFFIVLKFGNVKNGYFKYKDILMVKIGGWGWNLGRRR